MWANLVRAVRMFLPICTGHIREHALSRNTVFMDYFDPNSEPVSKRRILFDLGRHGLLWTKVILRDLVQAAELGNLTV